MTFTKNKITSITIATILILSATTLATPAFADSTAETMYFTTFGGGMNVWTVGISYDGAVTFVQPAPTNIATTPGADGIQGNPQDPGFLLVGAQGPNIHNVKISDGTFVTTASLATVFHLEVPDPSTVYGTGIPGGAIAVHPLDGSGNVLAGVAVPKAGGSADITQIIATPANGLFYTTAPNVGTGEFGSLTIGATYTTTSLATPVVAAHGGVYDPFTGDIILFGGDHITQVDFTGAVVSDLVVAGVQFDQGAVDGNGHLYVADNNGDLIFLDYSTNGLVNDVANNFLHQQFLASTLDDVWVPTTPILVEKSWTHTDYNWDQVCDGVVIGQTCYDVADPMTRMDIGFRPANINNNDDPDDDVLADPLPITTVNMVDKYTAFAKVKKNDTFLNTNPGAFYALTTIVTNFELSSVVVWENYDDCTDNGDGILKFVSKKIDRNVKVAIADPNGDVTELTDDLYDGVGGDIDADIDSAHVTIDQVIPAGSTIYVLVKFQDNLKGEDAPGGIFDDMCDNNEMVDVLNDNDQVIFSTQADASLRISNEP